jgi:hypothetical protein
VAPELSRSGGHVERQLPVHCRVEVVSPCRWYSVNPPESTSTVPTPGIFIVLTASVAVPPLERWDGDPPEADPFEYFPQAARTSTATTPSPKILLTIAPPLVFA